MDVGDRAAVDGAAADLLGQWGRVDILVNNAGLNIKERRLGALSLAAAVALCCALLVNIPFAEFPYERGFREMSIRIEQLQLERKSGERDPSTGREVDAPSGSAANRKAASRQIDRADRADVGE